MAEPKTIQSTIRLPEPVWRDLRALSEKQALRDGGRPSLSAMVAALVTEAAQRRPTGEAA